MGFELSVKLDGLPKFGNPFKRSTKKGQYPATINEGESGVYRDFFYTIEDGKFVFGLKSDTDVNKFYAECPPLSYIMTRKALAFNNGIFTLHDKTKKEDDLVTNESDPLWKLWHQPNPLFTGKQFRVQSKTIAEMSGVCWWLRIAPSAFDELREGVPTELWILPPAHINIKWKDKKHYLGATSIHDLIDSATFCDEPIDKTLLYPYTDVTTGLEASPIPQSRLKSIEKVLGNIIELTENKRHVIVNRGAQGILSNVGKNEMGAPTPLDAKEEEKLQKKAGQYGLSGTQWRMIITSLPLQYQNMSYSPKELMIEEFSESELRTICNAMSYPFPLLGEGSETTFNNTEEAKKMLYADFVVPEAENFVEQYNEVCGAKVGRKEFRVSYKHIEALQGDKEKEANISSKEFDTALRKFKACGITYGRFIELIREKGGVKAWENRYYSDFTPEERQLFDFGNQKQEVTNAK